MHISGIPLWQWVVQMGDQRGQDSGGWKCPVREQLWHPDSCHRDAKEGADSNLLEGSVLQGLLCSSGPRDGSLTLTLCRLSRERTDSSTGCQSTEPWPGEEAAELQATLSSQPRQKRPHTSDTDGLHSPVEPEPPFTNQYHSRANASMPPPRLKGK